MVLALFIILTALLLAGFIHRKNYNSLDRHIASIYEDRLLPATFLFDMIDGLYQRKLLLSKTLPANDSVKRAVAAYNTELSHLIKKYEATSLTSREKQYWDTLIHNINLYNAGEPLLLSGATATPLLQSYFDNAIVSLNQLAALQVSEGHLLQKNSKAIIGGAIINMQLEVALLVILGILALSVAGNSKLPFLQYKENKERLN